MSTGDPIGLEALMGETVVKPGSQSTNPFAKIACISIEECALAQLTGRPSPHPMVESAEILPDGSCSFRLR